MVFAVRGLVRGLVRQVFGLLGFAGGLWVALEVLRWVGAQWLGARPAVVYWTLQLLVAALAGLAVASLFHWWGGCLRRAVQAGPVGVLDRALGLPLGVVVGMAWAVALLTLALLAPRPFGMAQTAARARMTHALVDTGARVCDTVEPLVPMVHGLGRLLHEAERRAQGDSRSS